MIVAYAGPSHRSILHRHVPLECRIESYVAGLKAQDAPFPERGTALSHVQTVPCYKENSDRHQSHCDLIRDLSRFCHVFNRLMWAPPPIN